MGYFYKFKRTDWSKELPNGRKFAQSGHPGSDFKDKLSAFDVCPWSWSDSISTIWFERALCVEGVESNILIASWHHM
jgi:hypothetical protein